MSRLGFLKLLFVTFVDISRAWLVSNVLQIGHLFKYRLEFLVIETVLFFASFSCWKQAIVFRLILLPFTKWKINYTPTKTLASNNQESWGEVHSERRNLIANKIRKYEKERKSASQLNAHMHTIRAQWKCNESVGTFKQQQRRWWLVVCVCVCMCAKWIICIHIVSMKQLIKLKMVLFNQTTSV